MFYGTPVRLNGLRPGQNRDSQRSRLYAANDVLNGKRVSTLARRHLTDSVRHSHLYVVGETPEERRPMYYPSVESTQDYVNAVLASAWFRRRWGHRRIPIQHSHGNGSAAWGDGSISLSVTHRRWEATILHEVAHILTPHPYAHHGPEFAGILLALVKHVMGVESAATLRESFRANRVRYSMKAVPKPDEYRKALAEQKARAIGFKPRTTTRTPAVKPNSRKPAKCIETAEEMREVGRRAALRGSDIDRAESAALSRATGDMQYEEGRRAFCDGYFSIPDEVRWAAMR